MDRIVVIGGGIAGLSVTWALAKQGRRVVLLEREAKLGSHSSAVNAGIFRLSVPERINVQLAVRSRELGNELLGDGFMQVTGGLYPCDDDATRAAILDASANAGVVEAIRGRRPEWLQTGDRPALWSEYDGIVDVPAVLASLTREAKRLGAELHLNAEVTRLSTLAGRVRGVELSDRRIDAETVIDCTGAWSPALPGAPMLPSVRPHRRHIFILQPVRGVEVDRVVWDLTANIYVRPCAEGIMACPCDETAQSVDAAYTVDPAVMDLLRTKLQRWAPALADAPIVRWWSGLRPLTSDHRFIIGEDAALPGLFRLTGFGGHGITAGLAAGDLAARMIAGRDSHEAAELSPSRFQ